LIRIATVLSASLGLLMLLFAATTGATDQPLAGWQTDPSEAWRSVQSDQRPMLLYFSMNQCVFCRKMERETLANAHVAEDIRNKFVAVSVAAEKNGELVKKFHVRTFPATVIVSPKLVVLDYMTGYVGPAELKTRLETAARKVDSTRR
jgi:protein disulfide-isomerase